MAKPGLGAPDSKWGKCGVRTGVRARLGDAGRETGPLLLTAGTPLDDFLRSLFHCLGIREIDAAVFRDVNRVIVRPCYEGVLGSRIPGEIACHYKHQPI